MDVVPPQSVRGLHGGVEIPARVAHVRQWAPVRMDLSPVASPTIATEPSTATRSALAGEKLLGVQARPATGVEHAQTRHLADKFEHRWPVVVRVVGALGGVLLVGTRHPVVVRRHR